MIFSDLPFSLNKYLLREAEGMYFANESFMRNQDSLYLTNYLKTRIPEIIIMEKLILGNQIKINMKKKYFSLSMLDDPSKC